jgi:hypothetical protein
MLSIPNLPKCTSYGCSGNAVSGPVGGWYCGIHHGGRHVNPPRIEDIKSHIDGEFETVKFKDKKAKYYENLPKILELGVSVDFLHHFPAFVGRQTLLRNFTLYELYKKTLGISGHVAEVGVYKGAGSILFGKLIQMFEPESLTMVHGFDHWKGTDGDTDASLQVAGGNVADENKVHELVRLQDLQDIVKLHSLDARTGFPDFFEKHPHLQFKMIFLDSGTYEVTSAAIKALWPRLNRGGVIIFDQYNNEVAPGETRAIHELLPNEKIETMFPSWMPSSFIIKK